MLDKTLNTILPHQHPSYALYMCILNDIPVCPHITADEQKLARWLKVAGLALLVNIAIPGYAMADILINNPLMVNNMDTLINVLTLGLGG